MYRPNQSAQNQSSESLVSSSSERSLNHEASFESILRDDGSRDHVNSRKRARLILRAFLSGFILENGVQIVKLIFKHVLRQRAFKLFMKNVLKLAGKWNTYKLAAALASFTGVNMLLDSNRIFSIKSEFRKGCLASLVFPLILGRARIREYSLVATVRALDILISQNSIMLQSLFPYSIRPALEHLDTFTFVASCTEIMYAWFYHPDSLPSAYNQWIHKLSGMDSILLTVLRHMRIGRIKYGQSSGSLDGLLDNYCCKHGIDPALGDWRQGFISCRVVHPHSTTAWCLENVIKRWLTGFRSGFLLYGPLYFLPTVLTLFRFRNTEKSMFDWLVKHGPRFLFYPLLATLRSASFLATFIASVWAGVCMTRQLFQTDIPQGPLLGGFLAGWSILLERKSRRGELALYVLPRAIWSVMHRFKKQANRHMRLENYGGYASLAALAVGDFGFMFTWMVSVGVLSKVYKESRHDLRPSVRAVFGFLLGNK